MVLETAQLLSTISGGPYKPTHINHPSTVWARESSQNFDWLLRLGLALDKEYTFRYGRQHKSGLVVQQIKKPELPALGLTMPHMVMPVQYKTADFVEAYRRYYVCEKRHILKYTKRKQPRWII